MRLYTQNIFETNLSTSQKIVWISLLSHTDKKTFQCFPSHRLIAEETSLTSRTVLSCIQVLVEKNIIKSEHQFRKLGGKTSNLYTLLPKKMWHESVFESNNSKPVHELAEHDQEQQTEVFSSYIMSNLEENEPISATIGADAEPKTVEKNQKAAKAQNKKYNHNQETDSLEAIEKAKVQVNYDKVLARDSRYSVVLEAVIRNIAKSGGTFGYINESMTYHICKKYISNPTEVGSLDAYVSAMMINQERDEAKDLLNDEKRKTKKNLQVNPNNHFHNFKQREYDYDALDAMIYEKSMRDLGVVEDPVELPMADLSFLGIKPL